MKTVVTIVIIIFMLAAVALVTVVYKPANVAIWQIGKTLRGIELVPKAELDAAKQRTKELEAVSREMDARSDSLQAAITDKEKTAHIQQLQISALQAATARQANELAEAMTIYTGMTQAEKTANFDAQTKGSKITLITTYEGHEVAIVEPSRIKDAAWKLHEGTVKAEQLETAYRQIGVMSEKIGTLAAINADLRGVIETCEASNAGEIEKRELCQANVDKAMKRATGIAAGGGLAVIIGLLILIL